MRIMKDYDQDETKRWKSTQDSKQAYGKDSNDIDEDADKELAEFLAIEKSCKESDYTGSNRYSSKTSPRMSNNKHKTCKNKSKSNKRTSLRAQIYKEDRLVMHFQSYLTLFLYSRNTDIIPKQ